MRRRFVLLGILMTLCWGLTSAVVTITDLKNISNYNTTASTTSEQVSLLKRFVGDTITLQIVDLPVSQMFGKQQPDTIWIKKRPKKNPQEGKHYTLSYIYKPIEDPTFGRVTPTSEINGKPFGVLSVEAIPSNPNGYSSDKDIWVKLIDLDDLSIVDWLIPYKYNAHTEITSNKINRQLSQMAGTRLYKNYSPYSADYKPITITGGSHSMIFEPGYSTFKLRSTLEITLEDDKGNKAPLSLNDLNKSYSYNKSYLITPSEYEDNYVMRTINSDTDYDPYETEPELPFEFLAIFAMPKDEYKHLTQILDPQKVDSYSWYSGYKYAPQEVMYLGGTEEMKGEKFYKMIYNGKAFYMKASDVEVPESEMAKLDSLQKCTPEVKDYFLKRSIYFNRAIYLQKLENAIEEVKAMKSYGLAIPEWRVYDESEYTQGTGINIVFLNPTDQMIKYISITFQGYNAVDDKVGGPVTEKCIGPIEPNEGAQYNFEYVWFTDIVEYAKIRSITVTYKNGSTKTIKNADAITFSDELYDIIYGSNPVEDLK